jgi:SAM-dependent methyltransferase
LRELGAFGKPGECHDAGSLIAGFGIPAMYDHLLQRWLATLAKAGLLEPVGGKFCSKSPLRSDVVPSQMRRVENLLADDPALWAYLLNCSKRLTAVMAGKDSPLETLFPGGSPVLAEELYAHANANRYVNAIAGAVVESISRGWTAARPLRILEVGAGTGGTTATLLPSLDPASSAYLFTDVSDLFLGRAREKCGRFGFARFGVFDLEKDVDAQGHVPASFDVIVGANVVHAVRDLKGVLERLSALLVPGGFLLLAEATQHHAWFDFTTGLIEGWQHFADDLRGDNPLLAPAQWQSALLAHGFFEVEAFPGVNSLANVLGQHVILARTKPVATGSRVSTATPPALEAFQGIRKETSVVAEVSEEAIREFRAQLEAALPGEREELMNEFVRKNVMEILRLEADRRPDRRHRLMDLGLDSLMAVQLRNRLETGLGLGRVLPASLMFDYPTIEAISGVLLKQVMGAAPSDPVSTGSPEVRAGRSSEIAALSDEEAEAQLLKRLERKRPNNR